jgi:hypothetical protein
VRDSFRELVKGWPDDTPEEAMARHRKVTVWMWRQKPMPSSEAPILLTPAEWATFNEISRLAYPLL